MLLVRKYMIWNAPNVCCVMASYSSLYDAMRLLSFGVQSYKPLHGDSVDLKGY